MHATQKDEIARKWTSSSLIPFKSVDRNRCGAPAPAQSCTLYLPSSHFLDRSSSLQSLESSQLCSYTYSQRPIIGLYLLQLFSLVPLIVLITSPILALYYSIFIPRLDDLYTQLRQVTYRYEAYDYQYSRLFLTIRSIDLNLYYYPFFFLTT